MEIINLIIGTPLGYLLWLCNLLFQNFGWAILAFTVLIKLIMMPLSLWVQRNSIKMIKIKPALNNIEARYCTDHDRVAEEQLKLYKQENYKPLAGIIPMLIQIPLILGILSVVYHPLQHMLHLDAAVIDAFTNKALEILHLAEAGSSTQLRIVELVDSSAYTQVFAGLPAAGAADAVARIQALDMNFLGLDLSHTPSFASFNALLLIPLLSGASAFFLSWCQNKVNVLQKEAGWLGRWGVAIFLTAFSLYFAYIVPAGVGLYWIAGNILAVLVLLLCNLIYPPKKSIDYEALEASKEALKKAKAHADAHKLTREQKQQGKADYKRFIDEKNRKQIVFYSEKSGFYKYFKSLIAALLSLSDLDIHYVTSDPNDVVFRLDEPRIKPYFVDDTRLIPLFMQVNADVMVMTVPDLGNYHLKRSYIRKDVEYIYTVHGLLTSMRTLRKGALDHFDTVFLVGEYMEKEIRLIEQATDAKAKNLVPCGYGVLEDMAAHFEALPPKAADAKKRILIAPSWQEDNILESCLVQILGQLSGCGYEIIIRPHPQYLVRNPQKMAEIQDACLPYLGDDCRFEMDFSSNETVYTADILMSDWSGISFEYALSTLRPVLFVNTPMKTVNDEMDGILTEEPIDIRLRSVVGRALEPDALAGTLKDAVADLIEHADAYRDAILNVRNTEVYHFGHSGETGARYILDRIGEKEETL